MNGVTATDSPAAVSMTMSVVDMPAPPGATAAASVALVLPVRIAFDSRWRQNGAWLAVDIVTDLIFGMQLWSEHDERIGAKLNIINLNWLKQRVRQQREQQAREAQRERPQQMQHIHSQQQMYAQQMAYMQQQQQRK